MKYCEKCGAELLDEAVICPNCGTPCDHHADITETVYSQSEPKKSTLKLVAFILMILSCVGCGFSAVLSILVGQEGITLLISSLIPLIWSIPMTIKIKKAYDGTAYLGTGFKVCTLLFVNLIAGILLLCDNNN